MDGFLNSAFRAVRSLFTPGMFSVFVLSIGMTIAALVGFVIFSGFFFNWLAAHLQGQAIAHLLPWLGTIGSTLIAWILFPGITPIIVNFFDDRIALLIERHEYPTAPPIIYQPFLKGLLHDLRFSLKAIMLNILVLPLYLLPVLNLCLFYLLNGSLLGREYFMMAARRHMPLHEAEQCRKQHSRTIMTAGITLAFLATIPILNLFAPFWGVAVMVHLYHKLAATMPPKDIQEESTKYLLNSDR